MKNLTKILAVVCFITVGAALWVQGGINNAYQMRTADSNARAASRGMNTNCSFPQTLRIGIWSFKIKRVDEGRYLYDDKSGTAEMEIIPFPKGGKSWMNIDTTKVTDPIRVRSNKYLTMFIERKGVYYKMILQSLYDRQIQDDVLFNVISFFLFPKDGMHLSIQHNNGSMLTWAEVGNMLSDLERFQNQIPHADRFPRDAACQSEIARTWGNK